MDEYNVIEKQFAGGFAPLEDKQDTERKRKRSLRNHVYYLKNQEGLKERAREAYDRRQGEIITLKDVVEKSETQDGKGNILVYSALLALLTALIAIAIVQQNHGQQPTSSPNYQEFDIGDGRTMRIPTV